MTYFGFTGINPYMIESNKDLMTPHFFDKQNA